MVWNLIAVGRMRPSYKLAPPGRENVCTEKHMLHVCAYLFITTYKMHMSL
jgi:hypothetical protein